MKPLQFGAIGMGLGAFSFFGGLILVLTAQAGKSELAFILGFIFVLGGTFLFGCGLVAAAVSAKK